MAKINETAEKGLIVKFKSIFALEKEFVNVLVELAEDGVDESLLLQLYATFNTLKGIAERNAVNFAKRSTISAEKGCLIKELKEMLDKREKEEES